MAKKEEDEFKYIVRIAATDVDGNKPVRYALTQVKGLDEKSPEGQRDGRGQASGGGRNRFGKKGGYQSSQEDTFLSRHKA